MNEPPAATSTPPALDSAEVSAVIANYNGRRNLSAFLGKLLSRLAAEGRFRELIIVDDGSDDDSRRLLRRDFPEVRLLELDQHRGFSAAANLGFREARSPFVFLLSNDMLPEPGFLAPLLRPFADPEVFVVSGQLLNPDGSHQGGRQLARFRSGRLKVWDTGPEETPRPSDSPPSACYHFGCGTGVFRAEKFAALEGFDEDLFLPFYYEDMDLFYRAWKRGWKNVYEPRSAVTHYHHTHGTIHREQERRRVRRILRQHRFFFNWKNLHDPLFRAEHFVSLAAKVAGAWARRDRDYLDALRAALRRWPLVRRKYERERQLAALSDRAALQRMNGAPPSL